MNKREMPAEAIAISRDLKDLMDENDRGEAMEENGKKSLAARLCAVMQEIGTIPKSGFNDFHNYHYATDADVNAAVRPLFAKHGIAVIPSIHTHEQQVVEGKNRKGESVTSYHTRVGAKLILIAEDGETMEMDWYGEADDSGDKGTYKAYTGLLKTGLSKLLMIDTEDDPEADTKTDERAADRQAVERKPRPSGNGRPATDKQIKFLITLIDKKEMPEGDEDVLRQKVREHESGKQKMDAAEASDWIGRLKDLTDRALIAAPAQQSGSFFDDVPPPGDDDRPLPF